jgi:hypothetical protein
MARTTTIEWPNREKASSKTMRVAVVLALGISTAIMLLITLLGWDMFQQARTFQLIFVAIDVIFMIQVLRWSRGVLPMAAGVATIIGIFGGVSVSSWWARDAPGYADAALSGTLGTLTLLMVLIQVLVVVLAIAAFTQNWQIEVESHHHHDDEDYPRRRPSFEHGSATA